MGEALMRCPQRFPRACARAADVSAHALPGDPSLWNFISGQRTHKPGLLLLLHLQRGELGDGRGKSSLLWIVIIGLLTSPSLPLVTKHARSRVPVLVTRRAVCKVILCDSNTLLIPQNNDYFPLLTCQSFVM